MNTDIAIKTVAKWLGEKVANPQKPHFDIPSSEKENLASNFMSKIEKINNQQKQVFINTLVKYIKKDWKRIEQYPVIETKFNGNILDNINSYQFRKIDPIIWIACVEANIPYINIPLNMSIEFNVNNVCVQYGLSNREYNSLNEQRLQNLINPKQEIIIYANSDFFDNHIQELEGEIRKNILEKNKDLELLSKVENQAYSIYDLKELDWIKTAKPSIKVASKWWGEILANPTKESFMAGASEKEKIKAVKSLNKNKAISNEQKKEFINKLAQLLEKELKKKKEGEGYSFGSDYGPTTKSLDQALKQSNIPQENVPTKANTILRKYSVNTVLGKPYEYDLIYLKKENIHYGIKNKDKRVLELKKLANRYRKAKQKLLNNNGEYIRTIK